MKKIYGCIMLVILTLVDQFSKLFITRNFSVGEEREVIKNVFSIEYIRNTGAAWGMFPNGTIFFIIFSAIVCIGLLYLYFQGHEDDKEPIYLGQFDDFLANYVFGAKYAEIVPNCDEDDWYTFLKENKYIE